MNKKVLFLLSAVFFIILLNVNVYGFDDRNNEDIPVVRVIRTGDGDVFIFDVNVKFSTSSVKHKTLGWKIYINNIGIIYKYPYDTSLSTEFKFKLTDLLKEYERQYGINSAQYKNVCNVLFNTGGSIRFECIKTITENGVKQGGIIDNPIFGKPNSYNYFGEVYDTLEGIRNARNWTDITKNVYLKRYFGVTYTFSKQPNVNIPKPNNNDLKVVSIGPTVYYANSKAMTLVTVRNEGDTAYDPEHKVEIILTANGIQYKSYFDIGPKAEAKIPFIWKVNEEWSVALICEVNKDKKQYETNYDNNWLSTTSYIKRPETYSDRVYQPAKLIDCPETENNNYYEWTETRFSHWTDQEHKNAVYVDKKYWARLVLDVNISKSSIKSGYGFSLNVSPSIETNYDRKEYIIMPQSMKMLLPESSYEDSKPLRRSAIYPNLLKEDWTLPTNKLSVTNSKKHYIPIWFPDNMNYETSITSYGSYVPGYELTASAKVNIYVNGNMYEDDITRLYQ